MLWLAAISRQDLLTKSAVGMPEGCCIRAEYAHGQVRFPNLDMAYVSLPPCGADLISSPSLPDRLFKHDDMHSVTEEFDRLLYCHCQVCPYVMYRANDVSGW